MNAKEYFDSEVMWTVETVHGFWSEPLKGEAELNAYLKPYKDNKKPISDIDMCSFQPNTFVARVLKLAEVNFFENKAWIEAHGITNYYDCIDFILENDLWRP